jgi:cytochrome P450
MNVMFPTAGSETRFVPPCPPRGAGPVPVWRGFFGERARTAVYGWSERAFDDFYMARNVLGHRVHIPLHPDLVQQVLLDNAANYAKPDLILRLLTPTIGTGLLTSDGELWREQRRIVAASFAPGAVDALGPLFRSVANEAMSPWSEGVLDLAAEATATTMRVISDTLFGSDPRLTTKAAMAHISAALAGVSEARLQVLLGLPIMPWSRRGLRARQGQNYLRSTLSDVVADRMRAGGSENFLGKLIVDLKARFDEADAVRLAVDNAATFYLAGHETTANAVTWTLYLLSELPELQERLAAEAQAENEHPGDLPRTLPLLRAVLDESMRIYPPVPRFDRQALAPDRLGDFAVEPGDIVSIWPWLIHRHRRLWDEPDAFVPDRFAGPGDRHRFQYLPFGGGPRVCVGQRFAIAEALTILSTWLAHWRFEPVPGREMRVSGMVTLRPAGGLPLRISRRG